MTDRRPRRRRGELERQVLDVTDSYTEGDLDDLLGGKPLTTWRICQLVSERAPDPDYVPSTGGVGGVLRRWVEIGFMEPPRSGPMRFSAYTEAAATKGLKALYAAHKAQENSMLARDAA